MMLKILDDITVFVSKVDEGLGFLKNPNTVDEDKVRTSYNTERKWATSIRHDIKNTPVSNLSIVNTQRRNTTNNVVFEIQDPRGFRLQISGENFFDIITRNSLINGVITTGEYVWGFNGSSAYLVEVNSDIYRVSKNFEQNKKKVNINSLPVGATFYDKGGRKYIHVGKHYRHYLHHRSYHNYEFNCVLIETDLQYSSSLQEMTTATVLLSDVMDSTFISNLINSFDVLITKNQLNSYNLSFVLIDSEVETKCFSYDNGDNVYYDNHFGGCFIVQDKVMCDTKTLNISVSKPMLKPNKTIYYDLYLRFEEDGVEMLKLLSE